MTTRSPLEQDETEPCSVSDEEMDMHSSRSKHVNFGACISEEVVPSSSFLVENNNDEPAETPSSTAFDPRSLFKNSRHGGGPNKHAAQQSSSSFQMFVSQASMRLVLTTEGLSPFASTCTVVNYLSAGYILLPWAFAQGGTVLSTIILGAVVLQTYISSSFVLEACARAQALALLSESGEDLPASYSFKIRERKFEISVLSKIFLGQVASAVFSIATLGDLYGITWAIASIFSGAFADEFPMGDIDEGGYKIYALIFMCFTVPLACTTVTDQLWIQMVSLVCRFIMVILMVITTAVAFARSDQAQFGEQTGPVQDVPLADFGNIFQVAMTCIFSTAYQFSVPTMAGATKSKSVLAHVFGYATLFSYLTNVLLACMLAVYFGRDQPNSSNLNWSDYHAGFGGGDDDEQQPGWTKLISGFVVLFAAIDGVAVYSLIAISVGEILMGVCYGENVHEHEDRFWLRMCFRLAGSIPQAIGAMFLSDLGVIAKFAGIFTVLSYTVCPALLALASRKKMMTNSLQEKTFYSSYFSSHWWSYGMIVASAVIIVGVIVNETL